MLSKSYRDLITLDKTLSGLLNRYRAILFYFSVFIELVGLGAVSDTLVRRRKWSSPTVLKERDILLSRDSIQF